MSAGEAASTATDAARPAFAWLPDGRTAVMGVLNVTPDSFSDGGRYGSVEDAVAHGRRMADDGADIVDVGGESTRPGASDVPASEELGRVVPVVEQLASDGIVVSVDTRKADVARAALEAGAQVVNDVSGGAFDRTMLELVAERGCDVVLMHMRGTPQTMDAQTDYSDVVSDVRRELVERVAAAKTVGIGQDRILLDPGLGFAKTAAQSLELVARIEELASLDCPLVVGPSRKRFVGEALGGLPTEERLEGTLALVAWLAGHGVDVVRVHDVKEARRVVDTIAAVRGAGS